MSRKILEDKIPDLRSCMISYEEVRQAASEDNSIKHWVQMSTPEKLEELERWKKRIAAWHKKQKTI